MSASSVVSTPEVIRSWCRAIMATGSGKRRFRAAGFTPTSCRRVDASYLTSPREERGEGAERERASVRSQQLRPFRCNRIANADGAAGGHLGINAAVGVGEAAHQRERDVEVARGGLRIDVG